MLFFVRIIICFGIIMLLCPAAGRCANPSGAGIVLSACAESDINNLLAALNAQGADFTNRVKTIAAAYVGAPYTPHPLTDEEKDWFPYRLLDCTMFVLFVTAFANSSSVQEAREHMRLMHYRNGTVGFNHRYHFTEDRITDPANRYFTVITERCVCDTGCLRSVSLTLNKKAKEGYLFGERLGTWTKTVTLSYIPRCGFSKSLLCNVPEVCGIAFVKKTNWDKGLIVGHEGLLINGDLYHASPQKGVCVVKQYFDREFCTSRWDGCIIFSLNQVPLPDHRP